MTLEAVLVSGSDVAARAEADDVEGLITAGRALWDDATRGSWKQSTRRLSVLFLFDGVLSAMTEGRRP
jgi:hypothetical protein